MQGFAANPVYVKGEVFAYVGLPQNPKDLKDLKDPEPHTPGFITDLFYGSARPQRLDDAPGYPHQNLSTPPGVLIDMEFRLQLLLVLKK